MPHPFADLGLVIKELGASAGSSSVVRRRFSGATLVNGLMTEGAASDTPVAATVEPLSPREARNTPGGETTSEAISLHTQAEFRTSDVESQVLADQVLWNGKTYQVVQVADWRDQAGYMRVMARRIGA